MTPAEFAAHVQRLAAERPRTLVGIAGPPGSGKSTLATSLLARLGPDAVVLPMDGFHLPQARLVELGRRDRMGAPDTFDVDGFVRVIQQVRAAHSRVRVPLFDRTVEEPVPDALEVTGDIRIVIIEGNYLLHDRDGWGRVAPLLDLVAYAEQDDDVRRERLIARHVAYGKSPEAARDWVLRSDEANARLVAATAHRADVTVHVD